MGVGWMTAFQVAFFDPCNFALRPEELVLLFRSYLGTEMLRSSSRIAADILEVMIAETFASTRNDFHLTPTDCLQLVYHVLAL